MRNDSPMSAGKKYLKIYYLLCMHNKFILQRLKLLFVPNTVLLLIWRVLKVNQSGKLIVSFTKNQ